MNFGIIKRVKNSALTLIGKRVFFSQLSSGEQFLRLRHSSEQDVGVGDEFGNLTVQIVFTDFKIADAGRSLIELWPDSVIHL